MVRTQILILSLGTAVAVIGGVLAWQGLLPGVPPLRPSVQSSAPLTAKAPAATPAPVAKSATKPVAKPVTKPADVAAAPAAKPQPIIPQFDTVRVEPSGETVVAGHGEPTATIALMNGETELGDAKADDGGDFVIVPQPLPPGNYVLALRSTLGSAAPVRSKQTITVSVPAKGQKGVVVALTEPGKPSQLLTDPTAQSADAAKQEKEQKQEQAAKSETSPQVAPAPATDQASSSQAASAEASSGKAEAPKPTVAIKTAEVDKGRFYALGLAPPGTHVRIYLNGSALADVVADAEGHWSLTVGKGITAGHYVVRADAIDAKGKVLARAEVPFDVPVAVAEAAAPTAKLEPAADARPSAAATAGNAHEGEGKPKLADAAAPSSAPSPAPSPSQAVVREVSTATVTRGDSLWRISRKTLGHGVRYTLIYQANASQIRDPNLIYPGQVFVLPHSD